MVFRIRYAPYSLTVALACLLSGCSKPVRDQLREFGYSEIQPPSILLSPGTLVTLKQADPLIVGIVCQRESSLGPAIAAKVLSSPSTTSTKTKSLEGTFDLAAPYVKSVSAGVQADAIEGISITMTNVVIEELPDDAVIDGVKDRSAGCTSAVAVRRAKNDRVSMIKSVVAADVNYVIRYSSSITATAKAELTKKIAGRLGMSTAATGEESVSGSHLFWGVRDDVELGAYDGGRLPTTGAGERTRLFDPGAMIIIANDSP